MDDLRQLLARDITLLVAAIDRDPAQICESEPIVDRAASMATKLGYHEPPVVIRRQSFDDAGGKRHVVSVKFASPHGKGVWTQLRSNGSKGFEQESFDEFWRSRFKALVVQWVDELNAPTGMPASGVFPSHAACDVLQEMARQRNPISRTAALEGASKNKSRDTGLFDELAEQGLIEQHRTKKHLWRVSAKGADILKQFKQPS